MRFSVFSLLLVAGLSVVLASSALGQSSSLLMAQAPRSNNGTNGDAQPAVLNGSAVQREPLFLSTEPKDEVLPMTRALEAASLYGIPARIPRKFKVEDLITIVVRQQRKYEADAEMESKKKWGLSGKLSDWFRFYDDAKHLGQDKLSNGEPGFKFNFDNNYKTEGESDREDSFTTRITARIVDVKPNGNLVVEAILEEQHDEEVASLTVTGICRSTDVTPDNTVLSTQIAELRIVEKNHGAVRDATTRGFVPRILQYGGGPF